MANRILQDMSALDGEVFWREGGSKLSTTNSDSQIKTARTRVASIYWSQTNIWYHATNPNTHFPSTRCCSEI